MKPGFETQSKLCAYSSTTAASCIISFKNLLLKKGRERHPARSLSYSLGCPHPRCLGWSPFSTPCSSFKCLGGLPCGSLGWRPGLLALAWSSAGSCSTWGSEPVDGSSLSLKSNQQQKTFVKNQRQTQPSNSAQKPLARVESLSGNRAS